MTQIQIGSFGLKIDPLWIDVLEPVARSKEKIRGKVQYVSYETNDGGFLRAGFFKFEDNSMVMRGVALIDGPEKYSRLIRAGSMEVAEYGPDQLSCRVRAMRYNELDRQNVANISWPSLNALTNIDAKSQLRDLGAIEFGLAGEILGITNRTANQEAMRFPSTDLRSLYAVWGMTRIVPVMKDFGRDGVGVLN